MNSNSAPKYLNKATEFSVASLFANTVADFTELSENSPQ